MKVKYQIVWALLVLILSVHLLTKLGAAYGGVMLFVSYLSVISQI